jgi:hypothetical protein
MPFRMSFSQATGPGVEEYLACVFSELGMDPFTPAALVPRVHKPACGSLAA